MCRHGVQQKSIPWWHCATNRRRQMMTGLLQDLRYALRQLRKSPGFAATAMLVLTLGICASVSIFAFVDAVLIKPLPYANPNRLVDVTESVAAGVLQVPADALCRRVRARGPYDQPSGIGPKLKRIAGRVRQPFKPHPVPKPWHASGDEVLDAGKVAGEKPEGKEREQEGGQVPFHIGFARQAAGAAQCRAVPTAWAHPARRPASAARVRNGRKVRSLPARLATSERSFQNPTARPASAAAPRAARGRAA